jgi:hypothetical protein
MAQPSSQGVPPTLLGFTPQSFLRSLLSTEDHHSHDNGRVYGGDNPYSDHTLYQGM